MSVGLAHVIRRAHSEAETDPSGGGNGLRGKSVNIGTRLSSSGVLPSTMMSESRHLTCGANVLVEGPSASFVQVFEDGLYSQF